LFGREFGFDDVLSMWDAIFADDPSLEIVDLVCLNMLLRLHWECKQSSPTNSSFMVQRADQFQ
jgi:TBC1 domain family protein 5